MKLKNYGIILAATILLPLTSCETLSSKKKPLLNIYQPRILQLKQGIKVETKDGIYTPQVDEVWHSDASFREIENKLIY